VHGGANPLFFIGCPDVRPSSSDSDRTSGHNWISTEKELSPLVEPSTLKEG